MKNPPFINYHCMELLYVRDLDETKCSIFSVFA